MPAAAASLGGAAVMSTGALSIALRALGHHAASLAALWLAAALWAVLAALVAGHAARHRGHLPGRRRSPAALTMVAGLAVVGERAALAGRPRVGLAALALAALMWAVLTPAVLRTLPRRIPGAGLLPVVATESLAVLAATVAASEGAPVLLPVALVLGVLGLAAYPPLIARFRPGEVRTGGGDQWIAGGSLALCALCAQTFADAVAATGTMTALHGPSEGAAVVLLALAAVWFPVLLTAEVRWPRPRHSPLRWATVFPVGMYAAACAAVGAAHDAGALADAGKAGAWATVALWLAVAAGAALGMRPGDAPAPERP